ncbi:MAG TPA: glycosyltransferase [Gaiellaceae bacterium]
MAICMATHEPPAHLLSRQIESIRRQTHRRFVCLVSDDGSDPELFAGIERLCTDDSRFVVSRADARLGFYRNFERCLSLVPAEAEFVALADHDDLWHSDKLATLISALQKSNALLAYSDMRVVDADGATIAFSYWNGRRNNHTKLGSLLLTNTVTGAASMFRRQLLDDALPFPPGVGPAFHDHWIACVALAFGEIAYVERPLYDYVQHEANVIGHNPPDAERRSGLVHVLRRFASNPRLRVRNTMASGRAIYIGDVVRLEVLARTLERRSSGRIRPDRMADIRRVARLSSSTGSLGWLLARSARDLRGDSETLGAETELVKGIAWRHAQTARARFRRIRLGGPAGR